MAEDKPLPPTIVPGSGDYRAYLLEKLAEGRRARENAAAPRDAEPAPAHEMPYMRAVAVRLDREAEEAAAREALFAEAVRKF